MFKFIHTADIHLDSPLRGLQRYANAPVGELRNATRRAFSHLIDFAIEQQVAFVLIAGDLYDGDWKDYNTGLFFVDCMRRLRDAGISAYVVAGNHDAQSQMTSHLRLPDNVSLFSTRKPQTIYRDDLGVAITGQGFAERAVTDDLSLAYPMGDPMLFNIGLLHTCLDGKPGHEPYAPCSLDGLRSKGYQYWALGHVHQREIVSNDPWIVFPGNLQGRHARETGPKGCTLVAVDNHEVIDVTHHAMDVVRWERIDVAINDCQHLDDVLETCRRAFQHALDDADGRLLAARLELTGQSNLHRELHANHSAITEQCRALSGDLSGAGFWLEKVALLTVLPSQGTNLSDSHPALARLLSGLQIEHIEPEVREAITAELLPLQHKLPASLRLGDEAYDPLIDAFSSKALEDVAQMLIHRLLMADQN